MLVCFGSLPLRQDPDALLRTGILLDMGPVGQSWHHLDTGRYRFWLHLSNFGRISGIFSPCCPHICSPPQDRPCHDSLVCTGSTVNRRCLYSDPCREFCRVRSKYGPYRGTLKLRQPLQLRTGACRPSTMRLPLSWPFVGAFTLSGVVC